MLVPPKLKLIFSSPKTMFWNCPYTADVGDLPGIPESKYKEPDPFPSP